MNILYEKDKITDNEAQIIFDKFIADDYIQVDSTDDDNFQSALYSNMKNLIKVDTLYYDNEDLNFLRIVEIPIKISNISSDFTFSSLKVKKMIVEHLNFSVTYNQLVLIINALVTHSEFLNKRECVNITDDLRTKLAIKNTQHCINYLEKIIEYDFDSACEMCKKRSIIKNNTEFGLGEDGLTQSSKLKR